MEKIIASLIFFLPYVLFAQGINNRGKLHIGSRCFVTLTGIQASFTNSGNGTVSNDGIIKLQGSWNNSAPNTVFINPNNNGEVIFNGLSPQIIGGTNITAFEKLTISNNSGVRMQQSAFVNNMLYLVTGSLYLQSNTVFIRNSSSSAITRVTGCIVSEQINNSGKIKWNIGTAIGNYIFPLATVSGRYIPLDFRLTGGNAGNITVATYPTNFSNIPYPVTPVLVTNVNDPNGVDNSAYTVDRFWEIDKEGEYAIATMTFTAAPAEVGTINPLFAKRWNAGSSRWDLPLPGQTNTALSATVPNVSLGTHSSWILSGKGSTLPVELMEFNLVAQNKKIIIKWSTLSEVNAEYFTIEKGTDGVSFEEFKSIRATGNSNKLIQYRVTDENPSKGNLYYRLKLTDVDGAFVYFPVKKIKFSEETGIHMIYDYSSGDLSIGILNGDDGFMQLTVADINGKEVYRTNLDGDLINNTFSISFGNTLPPGIYIVKASSGNIFSCKKIIIR